jgi:hypothetical protein
MNLHGYNLSFEGTSQALARADGTSAPGEAHTGSDPGQRESDFRAVQGGEETLNGGTLLIEAYAVLWVILFGFVWISWRRQVSIDARVAELERSLSTVPRGGAQ